MAEFPVIVIGGGIGGMAAAARLSLARIPFLLLEQTNFLGGRCSTRTINGQDFEIGALYIGGGIFDHIRNKFKLECTATPTHGAVKIDKSFIFFPFGVRTFLNFLKCGVSWSTLLTFLSQTKILKLQSTYVNFPSVGEVVNELSDDPTIRAFLYSLFGVSGVSPYRISSRVLSKDNITSSFRALNPEYLSGGNGEIASLLAKIAEKNGQIIRNVKVRKILIEEGVAVGVQTEDEIYRGRFIISNVGIRGTVMGLTEPNNWPASYYTQVRDSEESLMVVNIFLTFSRTFDLPRNVATFFMPYNLIEEFETLENGQFPKKPMFILHVPSNIKSHDHGDSDHRGTLQFYYPRGKVERVSLMRHVDKILHEGLDDLFEGFSKAVTSSIVYDPFLYQQEFGFPPHVFGIAPDLRSKRFPIRTPIQNLFCVGDSVEPEGPCVPQAFESGLRCAQHILSHLKSASL
jgi:phytoene dehydrogenase-like protein